MSLLNARLSYFLTLASTPVSPGSFEGEDTRYSPEYAALEAELGKAAALHGSTPVDWRKILETSETLLREQSKDLRVAAWLTWSLQQCESFTGLLAGLAMLVRLCEQHWETLHPRKARTRSAALTWLVTRLESVFVDDVAIGERLAVFRQISEHLNRLDTCLQHQLGAEAPLLLPLHRRLEKMTDRASQGQPAPGPVDTVVAQVKQAASQLLSPASSIDSDKEAHKALRALQDGARPLCAWWSKQRATDPRALRLNRTLLWLPVDSLPAHDTEKLTTLRGVPVDKLNNYRERFEQGLHADLLVDLEASLARAPFWFDGQHLAWECLRALEAEHATREVEFQLALFLQRLPQVIELRFHDGTPFAAPPTRTWVDSHVLAHLRAPTRPSQLVISHGQPAWEEALHEALEILAEEGLKPAVQHLGQRKHTAHGGRQRFLWQLSIARLCHQARRHDLARIQLESLDQQLQASSLQRWEPDLVLDVLRLLHECCESLPQNHDVRDRKNEVYRRLCDLDLEAVLDQASIP